MRLELASNVKAPRLTTLACGLALLGLALPPALADEAPETVELRPTGTGHFTVDVRVNGQGPYPFVLDTGSSHTAVVAPLAEEFGFQSELSVLSEVQTLTEEIVTDRFRFDSIGVGRVEQPDINAVVFSQTMGSGLPVVGLLGSDVLDGQVFEIDYTNQVLRFNHEGPEHADGRVDAMRNVLVGHARMGRMRQPVNVMVDTGSSYTIVNSHFARWTRRRDAAIRVRLGGASRLAQSVVTDGFARVQGLRIGGVCPPPFFAVEADVDVFRALGWEDEPAVILGMNVLQYTTLRVDHANDVFELSAGVRQIECPGSRRVQLPSES